MTSVSQVAEILQQILGEEAVQLAKETGFLERERCFDGADFVQTLIFGWLQSPDLTLCGLTQVAQRREVSISASGLCQRFTEAAATFVQQVLNRLVQAQLTAGPLEEKPPLPLLSRFSAVIVEDSSHILLPQELEAQWRGYGSHQALLKLFVRFNLLTGQLQGPLLEQGRHSDSKSPFNEEPVPAGGLYLADLGFFSIGRLVGLARPKQAEKRYFVMRFKQGTPCFTRRGHRIELRGVLPQCIGEIRELGVLLGKAEQLPVRLIMQRVPEEVAEQRRARLREEAHKHRHEPSEEALWQASWTLVVTNVPGSLLSTAEVLVMLGARWQVERLFRLWKTQGELDKWHSKKPWRILCEVYAKLAAVLIQQWLLELGCWQQPHRSLVKASQVVRRESNRIMVALWEGRLETTLTSILRCFKSGCQIEKRKRFPSTAQRLEGGSVREGRHPAGPRKRRRGKTRYWPCGRGWASSGRPSQRKRRVASLT